MDFLKLYLTAIALRFEDILRPYPNYHVAVVRDKNEFQQDSFRRKELPKSKGGKGGVILVIGKLKDKTTMTAHSYWFPKDLYTVAEAKQWLKDNDVKYISFEPAKDEKRQDDSTGRHGDYSNDLTVRNYPEGLRYDTIIENEAERSIEAVLATEERVLVLDLANWRVVEEILLMDGCKGADQIPLLDTHDRSTIQKQLGSVRDFRIEDNKLIGRKYFSKSPLVDHAWTLTKEKHSQDNSLAYRIFNPVIIEPGRELEIKGRKFRASPNIVLRIVPEWERKEASICAIGADKQTKNRQENIFNLRSLKMEKFKLWLLERSLNYNDLNEEQRNCLQKDFEAQQKAAERKEEKIETDPPLKKDDTNLTNERTEPQTSPEEVKKLAEKAQEATRAERERVAQIRKLAGNDIPAEKVEECIREGKTIEQAQGIFLTAVRQARPMVGSLPSIHAHGEQLSREALIDGIFLRASYDDMFQKDKKRGDERAEIAKKYRDVSLLDLCRYALFLDGAAIPTSRDDMIRAAFSMATLPQLLGNVVNKALLKGYELAPETWRKWCGIGNASDYKNMQRIRLTDMGTIPQIPDGGEVKYGSLAEEYEQYRVYDYGQNIGVTNQTIINDDLNAITKVPMNRGLAIKQLIGDLVYAHLIANGAMTDGIALFYATTHLNLITSNALAKDALAKALYTFQKQTNKDGKPLNMLARYLLVPPELKFTAKELVKSVQLIIRGTTDAIIPSYNALSDEELEVVSEARLGSLSGGSTTTWYLAGDPAMVDTIEVGFLNGQQEPKVETFNPGPNYLGLIWRITHAFGCKALDWRGMQKNTA